MILFISQPINFFSNSSNVFSSTFTLKYILNFYLTSHIRITTSLSENVKNVCNIRDDYENRDDKLHKMYLVTKSDKSL